MDMAFFDRAAGALPDVFFERAPDIGVVLGSGWGDSLASDRSVARVSYADIPGMGAATVAGHAGELLLYERHGLLVAAFCGRRHWYEGVGWETVVLAPELLRRMGVPRMLLTNAVGGVNPALRPGDLVIVKDHINVTGMSPLVGPRREEWGPRFPDMTEVYSRRLRELLHASANHLGFSVGDGVYCFTAGPVFETPAEIRAYRAMGADLVGMSTVPEATFAHACGISVACLSLVSNAAAGVLPGPLSHEDVLRATESARGRMAALLDDFLGRLR